MISSVQWRAWALAIPSDQAARPGDDATSAGDVLQLVAVRKEHGSDVTIGPIDLRVRRGEALSIIGPSGGGKSTLLRCMALIEPVTSGQIWFDGVLASAASNDSVADGIRGAGISLVFQEFNLWPNKTVLQNCVEAPLHVLRLRKREAESLATQWLTHVGMQHRADRFPAELSGGERQRAALARALVMQPKVLLLDEVTSALDVETTANMLRLFESLRSPDRTLVFVTHHLSFAQSATERTAILIDGRIAELGASNEVVARPTTPAAQRFLSVIRQSW
jgi:polar amino acid transport system ATP-binding protein